LPEGRFQKSSRARRGIPLSPAARLVVFFAGPDAFAREVIRVVTDPALRARLERDALAFVRSRYEWSSIAETMDGVYQAMGPR